MPSGQLKDMRHVYRYGEDSDKTPGQRAYRKLFESNPKAFLAAMQKAESDHRANCRKRAADLEAAKDFVAAGGGGKKVVVEVDEGSRRVLDLVEQLLLEFKSGRVV